MNQNGDVVGKQRGETLLGKNGGTTYVLQGSKKMKDRYSGSGRRGFISVSERKSRNKWKRLHNS